MAVGDWYYWGIETVPLTEWNEPSPCYGHRCKLLAVGVSKKRPDGTQPKGRNMVLVEFEFGSRVITSRQGLRKIPKRS